MNKKVLIVAATVFSASYSFAAGFSSLNEAVSSTDSVRTYTLTADEKVSSSLGEMGGTNSSLAIECSNDSAYSILASGDNINGITVKEGQTLQINNVKYFSNFFNDNSGAAIINYAAPQRVDWRQFKG